MNLSCVLTVMYSWELSIVIVICSHSHSLIQLQYICTSFHRRSNNKIVYTYDHWIQYKA